RPVCVTSSATLRALVSPSAVTPTSAPASASASAIPRPIPRPAPVTRARLTVRSKSESMLETPWLQLQKVRAAVCQRSRPRGGGQLLQYAESGRGSSAVEQRTHKPFVASSNLAPATRQRTHRHLSPVRIWSPATNASPLRAALLVRPRRWLNA